MPAKQLQTVVTYNKSGRATIPARIRSRIGIKEQSAQLLVKIHYNDTTIGRLPIDVDPQGRFYLGTVADYLSIEPGDTFRLTLLD